MTTTPTAATVAAATKALLPDDLPGRLRSLREALLDGLVERDHAIRLALLAALAGEHLLLVGPPGTAKSVMARRVHLALADGGYFERLLTRFTVPEELFGPLSIKGLEDDRYERLTESYLPTATVAFVDEVFKANSAILNALLTLLNEREFDNGTRREKTPLVTVIGASNELAEGEELDALFDRFLLRLHVGPVSAEGFRALLDLRGQSQPAVPPELRLTAAELRAIREAADTVEVPTDVIALLVELRTFCAAEQIEVSDRRWRKLLKLLQVSALTNGRAKVSVWDAWLLQHCLWNEPDQRAKVYDWYAARVGASAAMDPARLTKIVVAKEGQLKRDQKSRSQMRNDEGELLYRDPAGELSVQQESAQQRRQKGEPLYLAPAEALNTPWSAQLNAGGRSRNGHGFTVSELDQLHVGTRGAFEQFAHWSNRASYLANRNNWLTEPVSAEPAMEPTRHKPPYIKHFLDEVDTLRADVEAYRQSLAEHMASLKAEVESHLWVTSDFVEPASVSLMKSANVVSSLAQRVDTLRREVELLPCEGVEDAPTPTRKKR